MFLSIITIFISGLVAVFEYDLKKIIALSTLRQLGIMMFAISLGLYQVAFFHLLSHALFKALLFLCAGILIHGEGNTQDVRYFGGLSLNFPLVGVCINLANFSLCGIPFMSGFYSKDLIVELACQNSWGVFILIIMFLCLRLTVLYSVRLSYLRFVSNPGGRVFVSICEFDRGLMTPVVVLTFISLISGPSLSLLSFSSPTLIFLPTVLKLRAILVVGSSVIVMVGLSQFSFLFLSTGTPLIRIGGSIWYLPWLSSQGLLHMFLKKTDGITKILDQG